MHPEPALLANVIGASAFFGLIIGFILYEVHRSKPGFVKTIMVIDALVIVATFVAWPFMNDNGWPFAAALCSAIGAYIGAGIAMTQDEQMEQDDRDRTRLDELKRDTEGRPLTFEEADEVSRLNTRLYAPRGGKR